MCWPTSLGIEIHLHSPAVGSAPHCPFHFSGTWRISGKYFQQRMARLVSEGEESTENTASPACIAIMGLVLGYGGRTCLKMLH